EKGNLQQLRRKNLPVRHNDADVRLQRFDVGDHFANFGRLRQRQSELPRLSRDRRRLQLQPAPSPLVGLRDDERDLMRARQRLERRNSEFGSAEENDTQRAIVVVAWSRGCVVSWLRGLVAEKLRDHETSRPRNYVMA